MPTTASCHCGATRITLPAQPTEARRCNCSFCSRTGAVWAYYDPTELRIETTGEDAVYSASGGMNRHHFCPTCGIHTWGDSPDWAEMYNADGTPKNGDPNAMPSRRVYQVNLNLIDELDWSAIQVEELDGRSSW